MKNNHKLCRKCFSATDNVVETAFADSKDALQRFVMLDSHKHAPSMCEAGSDDFRVCYVAENPKPAQMTHRATKPQMTTST